ncbi:MAG: type II toxin-antitoxin system Phd/YefM family antitoxin [Candidatus Lariskella arthropodorum]|uniref:type II toxin-antitoxin system Phd/YefM family antitoxin n=1 Tax=Candidatus Lariskella endosymbiont of Epinotia ramella TaxID=3066224 RepID=UPI0030D5B4A0
MEKVTYTYARQNLSSILDTIVNDAEVVYIKRQNGKEIVMIDAKEYESLLETAYIFSTNANTKAFLEGLDQAENKEGKEIELQDYMDS